ncbi:alpha/beta hydrolase [Bacillus sp. MUM 13]|uniref:alpha/beta fold hydrolase n=1 Tax=Bacillus sp. MUM 13 TaxID=1678001 RepID=UPI0008F5C998|nr:alpha/beta hydrolase [Bacillus sp. MUM 13]OIK11383.1 hypothetical protein BIV59_11995 [Bacillus sp. MUM 13]
MDKKFINMQGKKVAYIEKGRADAPPVLLLHGVPESALLWKEIIPVIVSCGYKVYAPDLPGFGDSEKFDGPSTWERFDQFVTGFTALLKIDSLHLVVHDWGGLIGLKWACDHPERILSLIVTDSTISDEYMWHDLARIWRTPGKGEASIKGMSNRAQFLEAMKKEIPNSDDETLNDFFKVFQTPESGQVILDLYRSGNLETVKNYKEKLQKIKNPATILWGEKDRYISSEFAGKLQKEGLPHANVHIIPDAGHFIHIEAPKKVNVYVQKHFNSLS